MNKRLAIIVDLDETLCTCFDVPVEAGIRTLRQIDEKKIQVHYVTSRTKVCVAATERFLEEHHLPGAKNVHFCPIETISYEHKRLLHNALGQEFNVIASIGDSFEEEEAAEAAGIPFIEVDPCQPSTAWSILAQRITDLRAAPIHAT
jgi:predicted secreted acid phosphatase